MNVINFFSKVGVSDDIGLIISHITELSMEAFRDTVGHTSSRNVVSTRDVDSTSSLDA